MTIFIDRAAALAQLNEDHISRVPSRYIADAPSPDTLYRKLLAAEQEVARRLATPLEPTEVFPLVGPTPDEIAALGTRPYLVEPGYDLPEGFFGRFPWGTIKLLTRPVIRIVSVKVVYPPLHTVVFDVPDASILLDRKSGIVQFTLASTAAGVPASLLAANLIGTGASTPQMIRVRYTAGLTDQHPQYHDVVDLVMRMAVVRLLRDSFIPQSASISADGLSQSMSADASKWQEATEADLADLRQSLLGPVWAVL